LIRHVTPRFVSGISRRLAACCLLLLVAATEPTTAAPARIDRALLLDAARTGDRVIAVGDHGVIAASIDQGHTWSRVPSPVGTGLTGISFSDTQEGWIVGHGGTILHSSDTGNTWRTSDAGLEPGDSLLDVLALGRGRAVAIGAYGLIVETHDGGATWRRLEPVSEDYHLNTLALDRDGAWLLAGEAGLLARSTDESASWEIFDTGYEGSFYGLLRLESGRLLAHGLRGHVFWSDDEGATWTPVDVERPVLLMSAVQTPTGTVAVAGLGGVVFASRDGGTSFSMHELTRLKACAKLLALEGDFVLAIGETGVERVDVSPP
jgi:photosystem II stability/assembly factor-like uncharacterized protein